MDGVSRCWATGGDWYWLKPPGRWSLDITRPEHVAPNGKWQMTDAVSHKMHKQIRIYARGAAGGAEGCGFWAAALAYAFCARGRSGRSLIMKVLILDRSTHTLAQKDLHTYMCIYAQTYVDGHKFWANIIYYSTHTHTFVYMYVYVGMSLLPVTLFICLSVLTLKILFARASKKN